MIPVINLATLRDRFNTPQLNKPYLLKSFDAINAPFFNECRMEVFFVALLQNGELEVESDLIRHSIKGPAIFAMSPSVLRKFLNCSKSFRSEVIFFEKSFFLHYLSDVTFLDKYPFFSETENHLIALTKPQHKRIADYYRLIKEYANDDQKYSGDIIRNLLQVLLFEIANLMVRKDHQLFSHNQIVISAFKENLEKHYKLSRKVAYYAALQNLSSKYFSSITQQLTGKTAGEIIDERIILEAKALLKNKATTIKQIAESLNFDDASNFGKYFKNLTGESPLIFRKQS